MNKLLPAVTAVLLGSTGVFCPTSTASIPGPGGVAVAINDFLRTQDENRSVAGLLADEPHAVDLSVTAEGGLDEAAPGGDVNVFFDVDLAGTPLAAPNAKAFATLVDRSIEANEKEARSLRTEIGTIRAACDSERCSWAVVDFVRVYRVAHAREVRVPMRATALLRYEGGKAPNFRIYQWHASRAGAPTERDVAAKKG